MNTILMIVLFAIVYICIGVFVTAMLKNLLPGDWSICVFVWPLVASLAVVIGLAYLSYKLGAFIAVWLSGMMPKEEVEG